MQCVRFGVESMVNVFCPEHDNNSASLFQRKASGTGMGNFFVTTSKLKPLEEYDESCACEDPIAQEIPQNNLPHQSNAKCVQVL